MTSLSDVLKPLIVPTSDFQGNFIDNEIKISNAEQWMLVRNPATGEVITRVPRSTCAEVQQAVISSQKAYTLWSALNKGDRHDRLTDVATLMRAHESQIAMTLTIETGKTFQDARSEVRRGIDMVQTAAASIARVGERGEMKSSMQVFTDRYPLGISVAITPFNLPFLVPMWVIPFAIAMGNVVIFKPSELCPVSALWIGCLFRQAGFPPGVLNILHGEAEVVKEIISQDAISTVSFVGSEPAGLRVWDLCRVYRKKIQANVSSKNHSVILADSPKDFAVNALVESAFGAAGQRCTSPKVAVLVGEAIDWLPDIVARSQRLVVGDGMNDRVDIGPIITARAKDRIVSQIQNAVDEGATLDLDGRTFMHTDCPQGNWLAPTVLSNIKPGMSCYEDEIFGPVLLCVAVDTLDEAIQLVNQNRHGNGCSIFTSSGAHARRFQRFVNMGLININNPQTAPSAAWSFTSNKDSFLGDLHFYGEDAINFFTYTKTVTSLWHHPDQQNSVFTPR